MNTNQLDKLDYNLERKIKPEDKSCLDEDSDDGS